MPRLSEFQTEFDSIKRGEYQGRRSIDPPMTNHQRVWLLNQLRYKMERAYDVVPLYDKKWPQKMPQDAYALYEEIGEARYPKEASVHATADQRQVSHIN